MYWNWKQSGVALAAIFLLAIFLVKPIGVSTQLVVFDGIIMSRLDASLIEEGAASKTGYASSNDYLNKSGGKYAKAVANPLSYGLMFVVSMVFGGLLASRLQKKRAPQLPRFHQARFGESLLFRNMLAFSGGVLVLYDALFGFVLQRIGAGDPQKIIGMLTFTDFHLMKAMLLGIGLASTFLFGGLWLGVVDAGRLSIKSLYTGVVIGGALLGAGWAIAGYCPGTGLVGLGARRLDGLFFVLGGLVSAALFTASYGYFYDSWLFTSLLGGKATLAGPDTNGVWAVAVAVVFVVMAMLLPNKKAYD